MINTIVCPKCHKAVVRRKTRTDTNYWEVKCLWCGCEFRKAKTHVRAKDREWIERGN
jgi:phage FluMu protein Com